MNERPSFSVHGQAVACWTHLHGLTLLTADGLLALKWPGFDSAEAALAGLLDGLEDPRPRADVGADR